MGEVLVRQFGHAIAARYLDKREAPRLILGDVHAPIVESYAREGGTGVSALSVQNGRRYLTDNADWFLYCSSENTVIALLTPFFSYQLIWLIYE